MYSKKQIFESTYPEINEWAKLYTESLTEQELSESTSDEDLLNTAFSTLLTFMVGDGNKVLKDDEWMNYLENDLNTAIRKGMFKPAFDDKQNLKKLDAIRHGTDDLDDSEEAEEDTEEK